MSKREELKEALKQATVEFLERKAVNDKKPRIDNSRLYAGSSMYYYCRYCGEEDRKPESFDPRRDPIQDPCPKCKKLMDLLITALPEGIIKVGDLSIVVNPETDDTEPLY